MYAGLNDLIVQAVLPEHAERLAEALMAAPLRATATEAGIRCDLVDLDGVECIARRHPDDSVDVVVPSTDAFEVLAWMERMHGLGPAELSTRTVADCL
jgi:hypothetical protein